jgi:hypothetical protein
MIAIVGIVVFNLLVASILGAVAVCTVSEMREARWRRVPIERPARQPSPSAERRRAA